MSQPTDRKLLSAHAITKRWPGVLALDGVNFNVYAGCVNAIVGENGAGKSTLMNILCGVYPDYEGSLTMEGRPIRFANTAEASAAGIAMVHQELNLVPQLNVAENIFLGREPKTRWGTIDFDRMHREAAEILSTLRFEQSTHTAVYDLKVGEQQLVEIAKALSLKARVMIFDEPTSSLSESETETLFERIEALKREGVGLVYITHKMNELARLSDYVTVLRDGKLIGEHRVEQTSTDEIVRLMVGRERKDLFVKGDHPKGDWALEVRELSFHDRSAERTIHIDRVSFGVRCGEVLGIYGLMGAGRTEIVEAIFGLYGKRVEGMLRMAGEEFLPKSPAEAMAHGIALIPEDRKHDGLVLGMPIVKNTTLASLASFCTPIGIDHRGEERTAEQYREQLSIKSHSIHQTAGELSGGNQQKVVLSKMLLTDPRILLLDEPTRGIDINAKNEIYKLIDRLAAEHKAIVVISSEMPEIMAVSDRIITICAGRVTGEFQREEFDEAAILKCSLPQNE